MLLAEEPFALRALAPAFVQATIHAAHAMPIAQMRALTEDQVAGEVGVFCLTDGPKTDLFTRSYGSPVVGTKDQPAVLARTDAGRAAAGEDAAEAATDWHVATTRRRD